MSPLVSVALLLAVIAAGYLGFACLALAQARHWREVLGPDPQDAGPPRLALRSAGVLLLGLGLALALWRDGAGFGALLWGVLVSASALAVVATLTWRAPWLRPLVRPLAADQTSAPLAARRRHP